MVERGDDIINYKGTTPTIIHGGDGNDTITAGPGSDVIYGEGGDDIISPAGGTDRIYTGTGNDVVRLGFESLGSTIYADNGVGETDFVVMMATDKNDTITMQRGGGTRQIDVIGNGKSLTTFGVENISIDAGAGADNVTIYDLADSGISSISVSMGLRSTVNGTRVEMIDVDGDPATTSDDVRSVVPQSGDIARWSIRFADYLRKCDKRHLHFDAGKSRSDYEQIPGYSD